MEQEAKDVLKQLHTLQRTGDVATGRNRNVIIRGVPEPIMKGLRHRERG